MSELSEAIFHYATNTGKLYQLHCAMARKRVSAISWAAHATYAHQLYIKEFPEESLDLGAAHPADILAAAAELEHYYRTHIEETAQRDFLPLHEEASP